MLLYETLQVFCEVRTPSLLWQGATTFSKLRVQFLGPGYCTEQNTDGIPSFVDCSLLRNGNHTLHQKSWGGSSNFFLGGGIRTPYPQWLRCCFVVFLLVSCRRLVSSSWLVGMRQHVTSHSHPPCFHYVVRRFYSGHSHQLLVTDTKRLAIYFVT